MFYVCKYICRSQNIFFLKYSFSWWIVSSVSLPLIKRSFHCQIKLGLFWFEPLAWTSQSLFLPGNADETAQGLWSSLEHVGEPVRLNTRPYMEGFDEEKAPSSIVCLSVSLLCSCPTQLLILGQLTSCSLIFLFKWLMLILIHREGYSVVS